MTGTSLLVATLLSIALLLFLILWWKLHPMIALLVSSITLGMGAGMSPGAILASLQKGMADLLGSIALIVGVGAMMGRIIEVSGGGEVIARTLIRVFGTNRIPWALLLTAYLVGIPVFFDAAFLMLIPLLWSISKEAKKSLLVYALPVLSALTATHGLIPPHPGAAAAAQLLGADLGKTILYGLVLAVPMSLVGGMAWGAWIGRRMFVAVPEHLMSHTPQTDARRPPAFSTVLAVVLFPVALIGLAALIPRIGWIRFLGSPSIALLAAAVAALITLGLRSGFTADALLRHTSESLNSVGSLILIVGAAGAFKQVILDCGAGPYFAQAILRSQISPLFMAFLVGAALRITIGSATAAIVTAAGIVAPIAAAFPHVDPALMVMGVATGGSFLTHVNDAGFWMVKEYCGMTVPQTLRSYSIMKAVTSVAGLLSLWLLSLIV
ncbi:MAG: GntP family permease [Acidobacteria bacterium]|nr:GntP family permease [Acidobacteriota bacterium]MCI0721517.1 GntP family permease [Acidobacteriota bacterium]